MATLIESTKAAYHSTTSRHHHQSSSSSLNSSSQLGGTPDHPASQPIQIQQPTRQQMQSTPTPSCSAGDLSAASVGSLGTTPTKSTFLEIDEFKRLFQTLSTVILDCRVLKDYELNHIKNSIHINCRDKITRRRLSTKKLTVKDIINCEDTRKTLNEKLIVIYDERTNDQNDLLFDWNPLKIVMDNLKQSCNTKICKILKGGFNEFSEKCPELCEKIQVPVNVNLKNRCLLNTKAFLNFNLNCLSQNQNPQTVELDMQRQQQAVDCIENAKITQILPYLYLGNECDSKNEKMLETDGIYYILNVTKTLPCYLENSNKKFKYKRIPVNDACNENLKQYFEEAEKFIDEAKANNTKVLVHCQAGISRSPTIVIAYLMKNLNLKMNDAYQMVREKRSIIGPNLIFMSQLSDYEDRLNVNKQQQQQPSSVNNAKLLLHTSQSQSCLLSGIATASGIISNSTTTATVGNENNNNNNNNYCIKQLASNTLSCMFNPLFH